MTDPVNLENLREMTGGDPSLEKELFQVFLASSEDCLTSLENSLAPGGEETWRTQAHAWKGMSLNLGADKLGQLCSKAQTGNMAAQEEKAALLAEIKAEYALVKAYLSALE